MMDNETGNTVKNVRLQGVKEGHKGQYIIEAWYSISNTMGTGYYRPLRKEIFDSYHEALEIYDHLVEDGWDVRLVHHQVLHQNKEHPNYED